MKTWLPPVEIVISDGVSIKLTRATQHAPSFQINPVTVIDESYKICKSASRVGRGVGGEATRDPVPAQLSDCGQSPLIK